MRWWPASTTASPRPLLPGLTDAGRAAWTSPWALWSLSFSGAPDHSMSALAVDGVALNEAISTDEGRIDVSRAPLDPAEVWDRIADAIFESLGA